MELGAQLLKLARRILPIEKISFCKRGVLEILILNWGSLRDINSLLDLETGLFLNYINDLGIDGKSFCWLY